MNYSLSSGEYGRAAHLIRLLIGITIPSIIAAKYISLPVSATNLIIMAGLGFLLLGLPKERPLHLFLRLLTVIVILAVIILIICDAANYRIKGEPVNFYFWEVISWTTIRVYLSAFPHLLLLCAFVIFLPLYEAGVAFRRSWKCPQKLAVFLAISISVIAAIGESSPKHVIKSYFSHAKTKKYIHDLSALPKDFIKRDDVKTKSGKNIVWIYVESLHKAMADDSQFPGLMPYLKRATDDGISFQSLKQIPGLQSSMGGILATQCGRIFNSNVPQDYDVCLGHMLHSAGYNQVFLKGADLAFEDFGPVFKSWNFDEVFGTYEIEAAYPQQFVGKRGGWGYVDSVLFELAYKKYLELSEKGKPFHLALFTVDTHDGTYDLEACKKNSPYTGPGKDNHMVQAFHCDDMLLREFIDKISRLPAFKNTIIAVVGDHIMHEPLLLINSEQDKIFGTILNTGKTIKVQEPATHMDFAPTVLSLAGVQTNATFLDGKDLFGNKPALRQIEFTRLPDDVRAELGIIYAPEIESKGVVYKHTAFDFYHYVHEQKSPSTEKAGIRAYFQETQSYLWNNMMVLLESRDCLSLIGLPYLQFTDQQSHQARLDFPMQEAEIYRHDGLCMRLISGYVSHKALIKKLQVGIERQNTSYWLMDLR